MSRTKTTKTKSQNLSVADIVATAPSFRPESLILSDIKWTTTKRMWLLLEC